MDGIYTTVNDVIGGIFGVIKGEQDVEKTKILNTVNPNIENQLATATKTNTLLMWGAFGLLFFGAFIAIQKRA